MFSKILKVLAVLLVILAVVIAFQPSGFRYSRSITINAAPEVVFPHVNELRKWETWSPWFKQDPNAKYTYSGPASGTGAAVTWDSENENVGEGTSTVLESRGTEYILLRLDMKRPFAGTNSADFSFRSDGGKTIVAWSLFGVNGYKEKAIGLMIGLFIDCEKMINEQFDQGLTGLKSVAEGTPKP